MSLGSLVCGLLISITYLVDFLYFQWGLKSRPCCEILYIRCTHITACAACFVSYVNSLEKSPPPLHATDNSTFTSSIFKGTFYFLLKYVLPPVRFTLTQVVLLLITSTFTQVQIQSNLGTTARDTQTQL
jgi:hypothetical protein